MNEESSLVIVAEVPNAKKRISKRKQQIFLETLRQTGQIKKSAEAAGYTTSVFLRRLRKEDPEFAQAWDEALEAGIDVLEDEAIRRAHEGIEKDVYYQGEVVGTEVQYSDALLQFILRGNKPEKYRENVNVQGTINHKIGVAVLPLTAPSLEAWELSAVDVHTGQKLLAPPAEEPVAVPHNNNVGQTVRR